MNMKEKIFVDRLFAEYENTQEIIDFKEEITINLQERIKEFMSKGMDEDEAFEKAKAELGDITQIADNIGKQTKHEAISQMYIAPRPPIKKWQALGFSICGALTLLAFVIAGLYTYAPQLWIMPLLLLPFVGGIITYLSLIIETRGHYPMEKSRALRYAITASIILFAIWLFFLLLFRDVLLESAIIISVIVLTPAMIMLPYMILTEKNRKKPWVLKEMEKWQELYKVDPRQAAKFGMLTSALWVSAVALFIILGFFVGFKYSWVILVLAVPLELVLTSMIFKK